MHCVMQNFKKCTGLHILSSRSKHNCVELTLLEGKLGGFLILTFLK